MKMKMMRLKMVKNKTTTNYESRSEIEKKFINMEDVILRVNLSEALIRNQQLLLNTLLDVRDLLLKR